MSIYTFFSISKSLLTGFSVWNGYRCSRSLVMGRQEQLFLCTVDNLVNSILALSLLSDAIYWKKSRLITLLPYTPYVFMPGLYYVAAKLQKDKDAEKSFARLEQRFSRASGNTLGKKMEDDCSDNVERQTCLERRFPKNGSHDMRSLAMRIDDAHKRSKCGKVKNFMHSFCDILYMHMPNILILTMIAQSILSIHYRHKVANNLIQLFFCVWAVADQGIFLKKPSEDDGFLYKINKGMIVRIYTPFMNKVSLKLGFATYWFRGGLTGKINAIFLFIIQYVPISKFVKKMAPPELVLYFEELLNKAKNQASFHFVDIPETIENRDIESNDPLVPTKLLLQTNFILKDPLPHTSIEQVRKNLQKRILADQTLSSEEHKSCNEIFGTDQKDGILYHHALSAKEEESFEERRIRVKRIFHTCEQYWDKVKGDILSRHRDGELSKCAAANALAIQDLSLELYTLDFNQDEGTELKNKMLVILQQARDREFSKINQKNWSVDTAIQYEEKRDWLQKGLLSTIDQSYREREKDIEEVKKIWQCVTDPLVWWASFGRYMLNAYLKPCAMKIFFIFMDVLAKSKSEQGVSCHMVNKEIYMLGGDLGLSNYLEAKRDYKNYCARYAIPPSLSKDLYKIAFIERSRGFFKNYHSTWFSEIMQALQTAEDPRLNSASLVRYSLKRNQQNEGWCDMAMEEEQKRVDNPQAQLPEPLLRQMLIQFCVDKGFLKSADSRQNVKIWSAEERYTEDQGLQLAAAMGLQDMLEGFIREAEHHIPQQ